MTTMGRIVVTILVAGLLVGITLVAVHWLRPRAEEPASGGPPEPPGPVVVETPTPDPPRSPAAPTPPKETGADWFAGYTPPSGPAPSPATPPPEAVAPPAAPDPAPPPPAPPPEETSERASELADQGLALYDGGRWLQAQKTLSQALALGVGGEKGARVRKALTELGSRIYLSATHVPGAPYVKAYRVRSGDTLSAIGKRFLVPYELIMRANGMTSTSLRADEAIRVIQGPVNLKVLKRRHELQAWLGEVCMLVRSVGVGEANSTPEGTFVVKMKLKDPPYQPQHKPTSEFREPGAPDNPLGTRWIDIGNHYGIHGTIEPLSIGRSVSEGCIRMHNRDVELVYDLVHPGASTVEIFP